MDYPYQLTEEEEVIALDNMIISHAQKRMFFQTDVQPVFKVAAR